MLLPVKRKSQDLVHSQINQIEQITLSTKCHGNLHKFISEKLILFLVLSQELFPSKKEDIKCYHPIEH